MEKSNLKQELQVFAKIVAENEPTTQREVLIELEKLLEDALTEKLLKSQAMVTYNKERLEDFKTIPQRQRSIEDLPAAALSDEQFKKRH